MATLILDGAEPATSVETAAADDASAAAAAAAAGCVSVHTIPVMIQGEASNQL